MAQGTGKDVIVSFNGHDITAFLLDPHTLGKTALWEDITNFGSEDTKQGYGGKRMYKDYVLGGLYDDTPTTGSDAVFSAVGTTGALVVTFLSGKVLTIPAGIKDYDRIMAMGKIHRFKVTLVITAGATSET